MRGRRAAVGLEGSGCARARRFVSFGPELENWELPPVSYPKPNPPPGGEGGAGAGPDPSHSHRAWAGRGQDIRPGTSTNPPEGYELPGGIAGSVQVERGIAVRPGKPLNMV